MLSTSEAEPGKSLADLREIALGPLKFLFPLFLVPNLEELQAADENDLFLQVGYLSQIRRDRDSSLFDKALLPPRDEVSKIGVDFGIHFGQLDRFLFDRLPIFTGKSPKAAEMVRQDQATVPFRLEGLPEARRDGKSPFFVQCMSRSTSKHDFAWHFMALQCTL